ncbi:hypothetical protein [Peribacillus sp. R9-11]|uniref:hypothetical protein n=1 Tax=Peribacillus sp. R9-11 TaxID=3073271 RepID=UPI002868EE61|nr:hypothetical protein [Peribacillus sp. R9-11]WMX58066.1 hypothetical protein RE409_13080 [Peribacillus sp. R9-11]
MSDILLYYVKEIGLKDTTDLFLTLLGIIVNLLGIVITGVFSWLLWKATHATNNLARLSYELSEKIADEKRNEEKNIRDRNRIEMWKKVHSLSHTLEKESNFEELLTEPKTHGFEDELLAKYFNEEEQFLIDSVWATFEGHINQFRQELLLLSFPTDEMKENQEHCLALANKLSDLLMENDEV